MDQGGAAAVNTASTSQFREARCENGDEGALVWSAAKVSNKINQLAVGLLAFANSSASPNGLLSDLDRFVNMNFDTRMSRF